MEIIKSLLAHFVVDGWVEKTNHLTCAIISIEKSPSIIMIYACTAERDSSIPKKRSLDYLHMKLDLSLQVCEILLADRLFFEIHLHAEPHKALRGLSEQTWASTHDNKSMGAISFGSSDNVPSISIFPTHKNCAVFCFRQFLSQ